MTILQYGIHEDSETSLKWLVQSSGITNAVGIERKFFKEKLQVSKKTCPHNILLPKSVKEEDHFLTQFRNTELKYFLPTINTQERRLFMSISQMQDYYALSRLISLRSPTQHTMVSIEMAAVRQIREWLSASNLSLVVVTGHSEHDVPKIKAITQATLGVGGTLIFAGGPVYSYELSQIYTEVSTTKWLMEAVLKEDSLDLYKKIGAAELFKEMYYDAFSS